MPVELAQIRRETIENGGGETLTLAIVASKTPSTNV